MADLKERIARRCAKEFEDGDFINLGIGMPTMVADYIAEDIVVTCHSENGFAGIDAMADETNLDVDIINSGGQYVTVLPRVKYFDTAESFGLVRGGHVKATVLGAMEVAENGDLANWIVPGKKCVTKIITEMCVIEVREDGLWVTELHPDFTKEEVQAATEAELHWDPNMIPYQED